MCHLIVITTLNSFKINETGKVTFTDKETRTQKVCTNPVLSAQIGNYLFLPPPTPSPPPYPLKAEFLGGLGEVTERRQHSKLCTEYGRGCL
jgi:hypothetical protein